MNTPATQVTGTALMHRCPTCGQLCTDTVANRCRKCRQQPHTSEPYGYLGGACVDCGATNGGHRKECEVVL